MLILCKLPRRKRVKKIILLLAIILLASCGQSAPIVDSDGDGYSDAYEDERFNVNRPLQYNKMVSDLPIIDIRMVSEPIISINYEGSVTKTITSASSSSGTTGYSRTTSSETSNTVKASMNASLTDFGVSVEASSTFTFGESTTNSYSSTFAISREYSESSQVSFKEAKIMCPIYIRNLGQTPIIVTDMILTAYIEDYYGNIKVIGNLTLDNSEFKELALDANSTDIILNFKNDTLYPSELEGLLSNAKSFSVVLSSLNVDDPTYYERKNTARSKTARLSILHSKLSLSKKLDIVVVEDSLKNLLDLAHIQYDDNLLYINNERANFNYDGYTWAINHRGVLDNKPFNNTYNIVNSVDISKLTIRQGDVVTLYRDDAHWEDSPLGPYGDDLFYYYDDFAKVDFIGDDSNYWNPQYITHLSRSQNKNIGDHFRAEMFQTNMPQSIRVSFRNSLPIEVMVNDEVVEMNFIEEDVILIDEVAPVTKIEFRFRDGGEGIFRRYVQSYTIRYRN